jgi:hypothetical protein
VAAETATRCTPLHYAASKGREAEAALLLARRAPAAVADAVGAHPVHRAGGLRMTLLPLFCI